MFNLLKKENTERLIERFEKALGTELMRRLPMLGSTTEEALTKAGAWFDVPKPPTFNKLEEILIETTNVTDVFPITSWIQAYISYRYHVRVFAFSEYVTEVQYAARHACKEVLGIEDTNFVDAVKIDRP